MLGLAVSLTIVFNVLLIQRRFQPLEELVDQMERADLSRPGANLSAGADPRRPGGGGAPAPCVRSHARTARGRAPARLERRAGRPGGGAHQGRPRPPRRGQPVADRPAAAARGGAREGAARARAPSWPRSARVANQAMEELLTLARQLRPTALDDLGLEAALAGNVREVANQGVVQASFDADGEFRGLAKDAQLVVYRVAQEALSNAVRHSEAEQRPRQPASRRRPGRRSASPTTAAASPSIRPIGGSGSAACASARCSSAASSRSSRGRGSAQGFGCSCR